MKIEFLLENKILISAKYIKLTSKKDFDKIIILRHNIKSANIQFKEIFQKDLIIRVSFRTFKKDYVFKSLDIIFKTNEIALLGILNDPLGIYNQGYIDNFKFLSDKKQKVNWYELSDKEKYYYLRGCYLLNGVKETIDNIDSTIIVDLSKVQTDLDVYYEIGKAFFKSYGYFGTEINSFVDCLYSIDDSMKRRQKMPNLKIKGYSNFKEYFENNVLFQDFYKEFKASGFEIENM